MTKKIFGIEINTKPELDAALIKETLGYIPNSELDLSKTDFITEESLNVGNEMADKIFAESDKEFRRYSK